MSALARWFWTPTLVYCSVAVDVGILAEGLWFLFSLKGRSLILKGPYRVADEKATVAFLDGVWYRGR